MTDQISFRDARLSDAPGMSAVLKALLAAGKRRSPGDEDFIRARYLENPDNVACTLAVDDHDKVLGFQILTRASEGNPYDVTPGWGVIGTHIHPDAARRGIGKNLFQITRAAAREAGLSNLDATIGSDNPEGLAYYDAMGFRSYREMEGAICKRYRTDMSDD